MICFIPAWYSNHEWRENEQIWYTRRMHTEVDDTVKQLQLFDRRSSFTTNTLLLYYAPNYRHFLHRQGMLHSKYWSIFDVIQDIKVKRPTVLSFHDLAWTENIEFQYSAFDIVAIKDNQRYATIEFAEDGNMIQIDLYNNGQLRRKNIYDDRGFLSSTTLYQDNKLSYRQYLNEKGVWRICEYADGHVDVNSSSLEYEIENHTFKFLKTSYSSMEEILTEVFQNYISLNEEDNIYCVAMHSLHSRLVHNVLKNKKKILSFYNDRCIPTKDEASIQLIKEADYLVANSKQVVNNIGLKDIQTKAPIIDITPFDSRVDFGHSLQLKEQLILVTVDQLDDATYEQLVVVLMEYMKHNENARVNLFTRRAEWDREQNILNKTQQFLAKNGYDSGYAFKESKQYIENDLDESVPILFKVRQCVDELSVSRCLKEQRLIIDMEDNQDLFLQISAISMGIPQITKKESDYVIDGKNGKILHDINELEMTLEYYLDTLKHWNEAMIESYEIGKKFSSSNLVKLWEGVIAYVRES